MFAIRRDRSRSGLSPETYPPFPAVRYILTPSCNAGRVNLHGNALPAMLTGLRSGARKSAAGANVGWIAADCAFRAGFRRSPAALEDLWRCRAKTAIEFV